MRALVIGGSGQIGGWLLHHLAGRGHEATGTYAQHPMPGLIHLDAGDAEAATAMVRDSRPDVVFYPAGFTWVDGCERDPGRARAANVDQPRNLARAAADPGGRFVYYSTDYVFDGRGGPDAENSPPNPLSQYGASKLEAERALASELGDRVLIIRTSWVFGPERQGKNFGYQLVRALREGKELPTPSDMFSNPSYGPDVALASVLLVESGTSGLIHVAGPEVVSRVEFARQVATGFGLDPALIIPRPTPELLQGAPRPLNGGLLTHRLNALLPDVMRPQRDAVADFLDQVSRPGSAWADPRATA
jgi:dTDP-4-dehydrorhamnose reductase